jgi:hypothetical protein
VDAAISKLELALYGPLTFVLPKYRALYDKGGNFDQANREKYLIAMMKVGFLKRLESSVSSFRLTMDRMMARIDQRLSDLDSFDTSAAIDAPAPDESELDDELEEAFEVGGALKYNLAHLDRAAWKAALGRDRDRIAALAEVARKVTPDRDAKLDRLKEIVRAKSANPTMNGDGEANRKVILFTAFTDTARYLYDELLPLARECGLQTALVTGDGCKATFGQSRFQDVLVNFAPRAKRRAAMRDAETADEIDLLIATDCISEGQNLQDADLLVNVDIHWNPVRLIQRFGRIDRIGSRNASIRMVNFWPTEDLNKYLRLKDRVEARMALVDLSATGEDDLLNARAEADGDARWRDDQLTLGLHAIVPNETEGRTVDPGVIFCLRRRPADPNPEQAKINPLDPYYLVQLRDDGTVRVGFGQPKPILEAFRVLCLGRGEPFETLCNAFDDETDHGEKMDRYDGLIRAAVASIGETSATRTLAALAGSRGARVPDAGAQARTSLDYDLITWLIIRPGIAAA